MIRSRIIEIDREFYQPQSQHTGIEIHVPLRVSGDCGDVVNPENLLTHVFLLMRPRFAMKLYMLIIVLSLPPSSRAPLLCLSKCVTEHD
jgi:hypothetical protein